jgi:hypothetical protein
MSQNLKINSTKMFLTLIEFNNDHLLDENSNISLPEQYDSQDIGLNIFTNPNAFTEEGEGDE